MKVKLNPMFDTAKGQLGGLVFRQVNGVTIAGRKPAFALEPTIEQAAARARFKQAVEYGKSVMADNTVRPLYEAEARSRNIPVFALTVADYFNAPSITNIDLSAYRGNVGDVIKIHAMDDFGVASVHVTLTNSDTNAPIENGRAVESAPGSGIWLYTTTVKVADPNVKFEVVAADRPGGTAVSTASISL